MMNVRENLFVAIDTLRAHKVRSGLTILGIVIGVTSVISVTSIIDGLNGYIQHKVEQFGARTYFISRIPFGGRFGRLPEKIRTRKFFEATDAPYIKASCPSVSFVTTFGTRAPFLGGDIIDVRYGNERVERIILRGAEPEYADAIPLFSVGLGRFISRYDEEHARNVVVIGSNIADSLFPHVSPIDKVVRISGREFQVVGVFEPDPGLFGGPGVDQFAVIPFSLFHKEYPNAKELVLAFTFPQGVSADKAKDEVRDAVRRLRHVKYNQEDDFEIISPDFLSNLWNQLTGALVILTSVISSVGLMVGGIGVMNIMLISVTERTSEIGVRKAIGARKLDIRAQFLLEAVMLTFAGGIIGILLGAFLALAIRTLIPSIPATVSLLWVTLGVAMSVGVGLFFGYYPANRAANLDPIVCLRYE